MASTEGQRDRGFVYIIRDFCHVNTLIYNKQIAGQQAAFGGEAEQLAEAEAGVEVVARAGGDLGLGGERALARGRRRPGQRRGRRPWDERSACRHEHADGFPGRAWSVLRANGRWF